jgi:hypothetical protein
VVAPCSYRTHFTGAPLLARLLVACAADWNERCTGCVGGAAQPAAYRADMRCCWLLRAGFQDESDVKEAVADMLTTQLRACEVRAAQHNLAFCSRAHGHLADHPIGSG